MATKKSKGTAGKVVAAAAIAGAAAGAYYLLGSSKAKQHRKQVGSWVNKAKKEITKSRLNTIILNSFSNNNCNSFKFFVFNYFCD